MPSISLFAFATALAAVVTAAPWPAHSLDERGSLPACAKVIEKDFVVVGGGAGGTYAAVRLNDLGLSVLLVEKDSRLGGDTDKYVDPVSGKFIDIGVQAYANTTALYDFYQRYDIPLKVWDGFDVPNKIYDFATGKEVTLPASFYPNSTEVDTAFDAYVTQLQKYPGLEQGWDLPSPVPEDLLMNFGEFVEKYSLQAIVSSIAELAQGLGNILEIPTLYVMNLVDTTLVDALKTGLVTPANASTHLIFQKAHAELGDAVLLSSHITETVRPANGSLSTLTKMTIKTPTCIQTVHAKRLVITIKPLPSTLSSFGLNAHETNIFSKFTSGGYYSAVIRHSGLNATVNSININSTSPYGLPPSPGISGADRTPAPGLVNMRYASATPLAAAEVQALMLAAAARVAGTSSAAAAEVVAFRDAGPYALRVGAADIAGGFYGGLRGLQGYRNTFWGGAAFRAQETDKIFAFTEGMLARWVAGLDA